MKFINEKDVMRYYLGLLDQDKISFIKNRPYEKDGIYKAVSQLIADESMHDQINTAKHLWKLLFETSMSHIDPDKGGYDQIFEYFDEYVAFEELIFASDSFYRDHTLHCLWVYFLGEYLYHEPQFSSVIKPMYYGLEVLETLLTRIQQFNLPDSICTDLKKAVYSVPDGYCTRCLAALTHDLGYPVKKIKKINSSVKKILPYYGLDHFEEFSFKFQPIQMTFIESFIDLLSMEINIHMKDEKNIEASDLLKIFTFENKVITGLSAEIDNLDEAFLKDFFMNHNFMIRLEQNTSNKMQFAHDFETYQHGIMSAYLLLRNLNVFKNIEMIGPSLNDMRYDAKTCRKLFTLNEIFRAISYHTTEGFKITELDKTESFLAFVDEIEEFSRISRANQNREFINEFCKTDIQMENGFFVLNFVFDNAEIDNLDPERAFKGRCKKMLTLFDIPNLNDSLKLKLNCIGKLPYDQNTYTLTIKKNFAEITINNVPQHIPTYLKSRQFYDTETYAIL